MSIHTSYLHSTLDYARFPVVIREICARIRKEKLLDKIEAIAFRGASGILVGMSVCVKLGKPAIMVRKPNDNSHAKAFSAEGFLHVSNVIIVDDCMELGDTIRATLDGIIKERALTGKNDPLKCHAVFLYNNDFDRVREVTWSGNTIPVFGSRKNS